MVKKKKASDVGENGDDSTESCDENVKSACPHITKAVFLGKLKKYLKTNGFEKECAECKVMTKTEVSDPDFEEDLSLWMCLRCGTQLCGRARNKHALEHFNKVHSDPHSLTANTSSWEVHCYECDNEVPVSSSRKLNECIEFIKKEMQTFVGKPTPLPPIELYFESRKADLTLPVENLIKLDKVKDKVTSMILPRVRGLTNLGNTCFFNSVMQCLVQTPYLLQVLQEMATPGEKFTLPGGKLKLKGEGDTEGREVVLPPITGQLAEWGTLTRTLAETLAELQAGEGGVYTPRKLLSALVSKLPQFDGGDQHDSHELLRHLLEAVRSEDLRRYQSVILTSLGMSSKVDPAKVDGEVKQKVKFYGQQASDTMLRPEQVFRGFLVSTLECQECLNQSDRAEYFLDLSLPVAACRPQPPNLWRRKPANDETTYSAQEENKPSKHQLKKEKKNMKKRQRGPKDRSGHADKGSTDVLNGDAKDGKSSSEQSDADVEDNLEDAPKHNDTHTASVGTQAIAHTASNFAAYHMDGSYDYDKPVNTSTYRSSPVELDKEKGDNTPEFSDKDKCKEEKLDLESTSIGTQSILAPATNFYHPPFNYKKDNNEKRIADTASNFAAYHLTYDFKKEKTDNSPVNTDKNKLNFVNSSTSTVAIPLEYKPLISLENLSNPDSGVASPETTKHNSTETVDNVDSPINGKELGSHSSLSSEINLDMSSPQHNNLSPDKDFESETTNKGTTTELDRPPSRRDFAVEYSNEVVSRGISVQGCKNVLEHSGESSYESLPENKNQEMVIKDLHNYYQNIANKVDELKLIMEDAKKSKPQPSPVHNEPEPDRGPTGGAFRPRSNAVQEPKVNNVDVKKETNTNNYTSYTRPTLSSPYVCEEDECSIQSCLSQFTALELLTGNNKVGCENCTERINGKDGKTVYTNATKRFLVSSPPAILILHLKRFQIGPRCMFRKMSKHVDFPTILDLAPFCAMDKLKKLPNVARGQNELLYSLYGVVEHSGGMHGGHYVAYVKVRQPVKPGDPRWWFLPKSANIPAATAANGEGDGDSESDLSGYESGEGPGSTAEAPPGKWYYISDSMVSEVTEDKVLNAQAYLLFYERIY